MRTSKFEIFPDDKGEWRFRLVAANSEIIASGEGYKTRGGAMRGVGAVQRAVKLARIVVRSDKGR